MVTYENKIVFSSTAVTMLIVLIGMLVILKYRETDMAILVFVLTFFLTFFISVGILFLSVGLIQTKSYSLQNLKKVEA